MTRFRSLGTFLGISLATWHCVSQPQDVPTPLPKIPSSGEVRPNPRDREQPAAPQFNRPIYVPQGPERPSTMFHSSGKRAPAVNHLILKLLKDGEGFLNEGSLDLASQKFEQALGLDPHHAETYFYLASLRLKQNENEAAIHLAKRGLRFCHDADGIAYKLHVITSVAYDRMGQPELAQKARDQADKL